MTKQRNGSLIAAIILSSLGVVGVSIGAWGVNQIVSDMDWVAVDAQVLAAEGVPYEYEGTRNGGSYTAIGTRVKVSYAYQVNGKSFKSSRYSLLDPWDDYTKSTEEDAQLRLRLLKKGSVQVWYDPEKPASAVLIRSERAAPFAVGGAGVVLLGIGLWQFLVWQRRRKFGGTHDDTDISSI